MMTTLSNRDAWNIFDVFRGKVVSAYHLQSYSRSVARRVLSVITVQSQSSSYPKDNNKRSIFPILSHPGSTFLHGEKS